MSKIRSSNFELLRIVAMILIVAGHFYVQTLKQYRIDSVWLPYFVTAFRIAVNLFLFIGVWFMVDKKFDFKRVLKIWNPTFFWSVILTSILIVFNWGEIQISQVYKAFMPTLFYQCWFASAYILLILVSPFLNLFCNALLSTENVKLIRYCCSLLLLIVVGMATIKHGLMDDALDSFVYFCVVYVIMFFYKKGIFLTNKTNNVLTLFCGIVIYCVMVFMRRNDIMPERISQWLMDYKSLPNICISALIFYSFQNIAIGCNRTINLIARHSFGVYIIHAIYINLLPHITDYLWLDVFYIKEWISSNYYGLYFLFCIIAIYVLCCFMDYIRQLVFEPIVFAAVGDRAINKINMFMNQYQISKNIQKKIYYHE